MSAADAVYSLRELLKGDDVDFERLSAATSFLSRMLDCGLDDEAVETAYLLLMAYGTVLGRYQADVRQAIGDRLIPALQLYVDANPVKGA